MSKFTCLAALLALLATDLTANAQRAGGRPTTGRPGRATTIRPARPGLARPSLTRPGLARPSLTRPGLRRPGLVRPGIRPLRPATVRVPGGRTRVSVATYRTAYGVRLAGGLVGYRGLAHMHWTRKAYLPGFRTWSFYDPSTRGWFYYSNARAMYLPIAMIRTAAPAPVAVLPTIDVPVASASEAPQVPNNE